MLLAARAALLAFFPALLAAQEPARGVIVGRVTVASDSGIGAPLAGARISVVGTALGATSASDGRYRIVGVPAGRATLRVRLLRYRSVDLPVSSSPTVTRRAPTSSLRPEPQLLSTVETRARVDDAELFIGRPNIGVTTLGAETMNAIPTVGEPDVARTVQLLPGVIARNDFNTGLIVHGGEADQNLVLLDGYPVHNPFHLGGLFGTFIDATVGRIELMSSALPARLGGRLSSVLDVRSADDARRGVHLTADVSALAATGVLSGGFGGDRGTWSFGARRTYADALQSIFTDNIFPYHFHDFQGRVTYALPGARATRRHRVHRQRRARREPRRVRAPTRSRPRRETGRGGSTGAIASSVSRRRRTSVPSGCSAGAWPTARRSSSACPPPASARTSISATARRRQRSEIRDLRLGRLARAARRVARRRRSGTRSRRIGCRTRRARRRRRPSTSTSCRSPSRRPSTSTTCGGSARGCSSTADFAARRCRRATGPRSRRASR